MIGREERSNGYCEGEGKSRRRQELLIISTEFSPKFCPKLFMCVLWHFSGPENSDVFSDSEKDLGSKKIENHWAELSTLDD